VYAVPLPLGVFVPSSLYTVLFAKNISQMLPYEGSSQMMESRARWYFRRYAKALADVPASPSPAVPIAPVPATMVAVEAPGAMR
jgi:hypothetical protein